MSVIKKVLFVSSWAVQKIVNFLNSYGVSVSETQGRVLTAILLTIFLIIVIKVSNQVLKPLLKTLLIVLTLWFIIGLLA